MRVLRHAGLLRGEKPKVVDPKHLSFSFIWFYFCHQELINNMRMMIFSIKTAF